MKILRSICSHLSTFLFGMIAVAVYHHWWINPGQVQWIKTIAKSGTDIGYPGDWVLGILFPAIPLLGLCLVTTIVLIILGFHARPKNKP